MEPTEEQVERTARALFARSKEGRDGFTWPLNGEWGRKRDLDDARQFLGAVFSSPPNTCPACGHNWALHMGACCYYCTCERRPPG